MMIHHVVCFTVLALQLWQELLLLFLATRDRQPLLVVYFSISFIQYLWIAAATVNHPYSISPPSPVVSKALIHWPKFSRPLPESVTLLLVGAAMGPLGNLIRWHNFLFKFPKNNLICFQPNDQRVRAPVARLQRGAPDHLLRPHPPHHTPCRLWPLPPWISLAGIVTSLIIWDEPKILCIGCS